MTANIPHCLKIAATVGAALALCAPASAQEKTAGGLVIDLGVTTAEKAIHMDGHSAAHPAKFPSGSQHILVTVANAKTHARIADANVVVVVRDPQGRVEKKPLLHTQAAGLPDYSELFVFGWSGRYTVDVTVTPPGAKPVQTSFSVDHRI